MIENLHHLNYALERYVVRTLLKHEMGSFYITRNILLDQSNILSANIYEISKFLSGKRSLGIGIFWKKNSVQ